MAGPTRAKGRWGWREACLAAVHRPPAARLCSHTPPAPQVCTKAPAQQQYGKQNLVEIVHCFLALGEALRPGPGLPRPLALALWA